MKRPFLHIFIFFTVGIIFYNTFKVNMDTIKLLLLINILLGVAIFILRDKMHIFKYIVLFLVFLMGITSRDINTKKSELKKFYGEQVKVIGVVKEVLSSEEKYEKYLLSVEKVSYEGSLYDIDEKTILSVYDDTDIALGDKLLLDLEVKEPNINRNPYLFNYKAYLESRDIFVTSSSEKYNMKILNHKNLTKVEELQIRIKDKIIKALDSSLNSKNSGVIKSIILGDKSFLEEEYIDHFRKLGLSHILAVSGLHIGIIFGFIIYVLDLFKIHRRTSMLMSIIIIWSYALLIGFPPSVLRASIMFSFLIIGKLSHSRYDALNILSLSGFLILLYRPSFLLSVGFQLSFLATFTILILLPKIQDLIKIKNKKIKSALVIIISAQIGVLPLSLYYFNELQTLSIISNLIIAPILTIGIIIGFLIIALSLISMKLSIMLGILGDTVLNFSNYIVDIFSKMTTLNIVTKSPSFIEIIYYYLALFILFKIIDIRKMDRKIQNCLYLNFFIVSVLALVLNITNETMSMEFIDIGQGDSVIVRLKNKNILIDTGGNVFGNFDIGENILLPYLRKSGVKKIDAVFLSHFDADHVKGLLPLFSEIKLEHIFIGYTNKENTLYKDIIKASKAHDVRVNLINEGDVLKLDESSHIEVLHPPKNVSLYDNENDKSLVFILTVYDHEILFTGDIEEKSEDYIIKNSKRRKVDILKVPHHGSKTSSKQEFIEHFMPKVSIIQLGKNNFGHPNIDVLKRYDSAGSKVFRNDKSGLIKVNMTKNNMFLSGYLKDKESFLKYLISNREMVMYVIYSGAIFIKVLKYKEVEDEKSLRC